MEREAAPKAQTNTIAIVSLVLGIVAMVLVLFVSLVIGGLVGLAALAVGNAGRAWAKAHGGAGIVLAIIGMVLGILAEGLFIVTSFLID